MSRGILSLAPLPLVVGLALLAAGCSETPSDPDAAAVDAAARDAAAVDAATVDSAITSDASRPLDSALDVDAAVTLPPDWLSEMTAADEAGFYTRAQPEGSVALGVADPAARDGLIAELRFPGLPALTGADRAGPAFASELGTDRGDFHYGTYRFRARLAACAPDEEVVSGLFTYFNDGSDADGNGIADNSEIDFEILCGTPSVLFLTVWTDYSASPERFLKWTRVLDLSTGDIWETPSPDRYDIVMVGNDPSPALPTLLSPDAYVELGFEWRADRVRYFATIDGVERDLALLTDPARIPTRPASLLFNVWHSSSHWFGGAAPPDYPASDATMRIDWAAYWR